MSLGNITNFRLDMSPGVPTPIIHASAGDVGRAFKANLYWNSVPYDIQGNRVTIRGTKPDRTVFEYDVDDFDRDDSCVEFTIKEQMAIVPGKVLCELREYLNDDQIGSANFILDVETAVYDPEAASESYIPSFEAAIEEAVAELSEAADRAEAAAESMAAYNTDRTPYLFRKSGGGVETGDREHDTIVGGTVAWNQLILTASKDFTNSTTDTRANFQLNIRNVVTPVYYCVMKTVSTAGMLAGVFKPTTIGAGISIVHNGSTRNIGIYQTNQMSFKDGHAYLYSINAESVDVQTEGGLVLKDIQIFDLTQMFGSTIADYIYSLEQATEGAGVAWFRQFFPADYYEYNAGELLSVSGVSEHKMIGFNQWDEEWENGYYNRSTGAKAGNSDTNYFRSKNFIPCLPSTQYYFKSPATHASNNTYYAVLFYDVDKTFISSENNVALYPTKTSPSNAHYMTFYVEVGTTGATYSNDICINFSSLRNGEYEPYKVISYPLDDSLTLRGLPKLDGNKLYYDGDTYESDGTVTRKYGVRAYQSGDESLADAITDGTNTVYKLTTPTTETADPFTNPQVVDQNGTEQYVTDSIVPVGHDTRYRVNLRDKLEPIFDAPTTDGTYTLTVTVSNGVATYSWTSQ